MVELQAVTVSFGARFALRDLSLRVPPGASLALWGPNGAGKSTTFHAILGTVPYQGRITVCGRDALGESLNARRHIGWAPQELPPADLSVARTVRFMADLRETDVADLSGFLRPFGLADDAGQQVQALSGGQRKRLSIALALLGDPSVLLLDEPTAGLDPQGREEILALLQGLREQGKTLILATHRAGDVLRLCDDVAVLDGGSLVRYGPAVLTLKRRFRLAPKGGAACARG